MNRILFLLAVGCSALVSFACTHESKTDTDAITRRSFEAWMATHAPQAEPLGDTGLYYEVLAQSEEGSSGKVDVRGKWIDVSYRMSTLEGDIFYNRDEATARLIGNYDDYTHYVPERFYIASSWNKSSLPKGLYTAFTEIVPGQTWRVYVPADMAFSSSGFDMTSYGYGGQNALGAHKAIIIDELRITDITENPQQQGDDQIRTLATTPRPEGWGKYPNDTVRQGLYMDVLYRTMAQDTIPVGSQVEIYYKVSFLDGQLIDSNIDSVLTNRFGTVRSSDITSAITVTRMAEGSTATNGYQMPAKVFYAILPDVCYGDSLRIAVPAKYGYFTEYMPPNKSESQWTASTTFNNYKGYDYGDYTIDDTDYYFGASTFYMPTASSSVVSIAEIKPYTPLIYELVVRKPEN